MQSGLALLPFVAVIVSLSSNLFLCFLLFLSFTCQIHPTLWLFHDLSFVLFTLIAARDVCADPGIPPGATRTGNVFDIDDKVKYSCNGNLFLVGSKERTCLENGQWTGHEPECYCKKHAYTVFCIIGLKFCYEKISTYNCDAITWKTKVAKLMEMTFS